MVSAIFQPEVSTLESQVAQLQTQIAQVQERIAALGEAEFVTGGALQALTDAVQKVSALAPNAIANLKLAVLDLFRGDDQPGKDDGNQPNPEPQPDNDGGTEAVVIDFEPLNCLNTSCPVYFDHHWEIAEPDCGSWELTSPLVCLLEDAPAEALQGQFVEIACAREDRSERFIELVQVSPAVAYLRKFDGEVVAVYAGGNNKQKLKNWGDWLTRWMPKPGSHPPDSATKPCMKR